MPERDMEERLVRVFRQSFAVDRIEDELRVGSLKEWDSLGHVGLMLALQREFGVAISPVDALQLVDVRRIRSFLRENGVG